MSQSATSMPTLLNVLNTTFYIEAVKPASTLAGRAAPQALYINASTENLNKTAFTKTQTSNTQNQDTQVFIQKIYEYIHHAKLSYFMPILFSGFSNTPSYAGWLSDDDNPLPALGPTNVAIGLKPIGEAKVFLEQYLKAPIQVEISKLAKEPVDRQRIFEIGNLASGCAGTARLMVAFLVFYLSTPVINQTNHRHQSKADWVVCTGTDAVRHILISMGISSHVIAKATAEALDNPEQVSAWGSYYEHNPLVLAINVAEAREVCDSHYRYAERLEKPVATTEPLHKISA